MALAMCDPAVKVQLFRLVDTPLSKRSDRAVTRHLREYFQTVDDRLPAILRRSVDRIPEDGFVGKAVAQVARFNATRMARRFIAGTDVDQTLETIERLRGQGLGFTIDLLGEAILSDAEAAEYQRQYLTFIDGLTRRAARWPINDVIDRGPSGVVPPVNISVKLSSLYSQFDPIDPEQTSRAVLERLRPILRLAKERGAFVNIDMEQHAFKDLTLRIFLEVLGEDEFRDWRDVGIAIQAYLKSCGEDLEMLLRGIERRGTPVWVRLVKGAYWDFEMVIAAQQDWPTPVWEQKPQTDANFEAQTRFLVEHHQLLRPAIGSHNIRSIAYLPSKQGATGLPKNTIEFQMPPRHGRPGIAAGQPGPAGAGVHAVREIVAGNGVSGSPAAGKYLESILSSRRISGTHFCRGVTDEPGAPTRQVEKPPPQTTASCRLSVTSRSAISASRQIARL